MKRIFDITISIVLVIMLLIPILLIVLAIKLTSKGPVIYWSERVGQHGALFKMPKFRSMHVDTPIISSHLVIEPEAYLSPIGQFIRASSIDELPQLWSVLRGDMSLVGPRPVIADTHDLIKLRTAYGVDCLLPGITGWAQIKGRDQLTNPEKATLDFEYLQKQSFWFDFKILCVTLIKVFSQDGISH